MWALGATRAAGVYTALPMSGKERQDTPDSETSGTWSMCRRALKVAAILFVLAVGGIAITAYFTGGQQDLPFEYEGFD